MAYVFRLQLKALRHSRPFFPPVLTSKFIDARNIPWRCYGGSALLESCNSSVGDLDGDSIGSNDAVDSAFKGNGTEDKLSLESSVDKLTSSIYVKLRAKANVSGYDGKDHGLFQGQADNHLTKVTENSDKWQKVINNARTLALKNKLRTAGAGDNKLDFPSKMEAEDQSDFSDLDLSEAETESSLSKRANSTPKSSSIIDAFCKGFKHNPQEKPINSTGDVTSQTRGQILEGSTGSIISKADSPMGDLTSKLKPSTSGERDKLKQLDVAQGDGNNTKGWRGKESPLAPQPVQGGGHRLVSNQSTEGMPDFRVDCGGDDPVHTAAPNLKVSMSQPSLNDSSVLPHSNYMVCVHNLPSSCNRALIKASMSIHGEVSGFYKKTREIGFSAYIQFKTEQGMEKALAARKVQIGASSFNVVRTDPVFSTVVRLAKVSSDTRETQVLAVCGKYGSIDTIRKRSNGVYDVFYQAQEVSNMISILGSLNDVTLNRSTWYATPAPTLHPSVQKNVLKTPDGQAWLDMQVQQTLSRIEVGVDSVWVLFEDLKQLTALGKDFSKR